MSLPGHCHHWDLREAMVALLPRGATALRGQTDGQTDGRQPGEADMRVWGGMFALSGSSPCAISGPKRP